MASQRQPDPVTAIIAAVAIAVVIGNLAVLVLMFIDRPDQRDRWR